MKNYTQYIFPMLWKSNKFKRNKLIYNNYREKTTELKSWSVKAVILYGFQTFSQLSELMEILFKYGHCLSVKKGVKLFLHI